VDGCWTCGDAVPLRLPVTVCPTCLPCVSCGVIHSLADVLDGHTDTTAACCPLRTTWLVYCHYLCCPALPSAVSLPFCEQLFLCCSVCCAVILAFVVGCLLYLGSQGCCSLRCYLYNPLSTLYHVCPITLRTEHILHIFLVHSDTPQGL